MQRGNAHFSKTSASHLLVLVDVNFAVLVGHPGQPHADVAFCFPGGKTQLQCHTEHREICWTIRAFPRILVSNGSSSMMSLIWRRLTTWVFLNWQKTAAHSSPASENWDQINSEILELWRKQITTSWDMATAQLLLRDYLLPDFPETCGIFSDKISC